MTLDDTIRIPRGIGASAWASAACSCRGTDHAKTGLPCQDATATLARETTFAVALADGAGSEALSHRGATVIARHACAWLCDRFDELYDGIRSNDVIPHREAFIAALLDELAFEDANGVDDHELDDSEEPQANPGLHAYASTMLSVAVDGDRYVAAHLGDGVIGAEVRTEAGERMVRVLSEPDNDEFANVTVFVTSPDAALRLRLYAGQLDEADDDRVEGFILMSDGPESLLYDKSSQQLAPACLKLFETFRTMTVDEFEQSLAATLEQVLIRQTDDDCSIVLLANRA